MTTNWTVVTADRVLDGTGGQPIENGAVVIRGDEIYQVGRESDVEMPSGPDVQTILAEPGMSIVPGLVDVHTHLVMPGDGTPYQIFMQHNDGMLLMQAAVNALTHLRSGVTTLADTGARGNVTFTLRQAIELGLATGPRLVLCGRPLTRTGGHCWFLGGEADGEQEFRSLARELLKEGADIIKVMATGGGTAGTYPHRPSLELDELTAAAEEAHALGKHAIAHTSASDGTARVLDAGFDVIFHCHFYDADGTLRFQEDLARRVAESPVWVNPTLWVNGVYVDRLEKKSERDGLTTDEEVMLEQRRARYAGQRENVGKLAQYGARLIAGSDAGWGIYPFGDLVTEMEQMVGVGLSAAEALVSATSRSAEALGADDEVGSLIAGKKADLLIIEGDPSVDISAMRNVDMVMLGGQVIG